MNRWHPGEIVMGRVVMRREPDGDFVRVEDAQARIEELERMVVWILKHRTIGYQDRISYARERWSLREEVEHDGTPASILAAVAKAMG